MTVQVVVPVQAPLHPPNFAPLVGVAVRVTEVPLENMALQVLPQLIPAGLLVTVPVPLPERVTVSCGDEGFPPGLLEEEAPPPHPASASAKIINKIVPR